MGNSKKRNGGSNGRQAPAGVWNRGLGKGPANPIRVRTKRLDEVSSDKIALAYWLLAKQIVENGSDRSATEAEARREAAKLEAEAADAEARRAEHKKRSA